jgi:BASS family bile acid:Na+ symporter
VAEILLVTLKLSIALLIFAIGLGSTFSDLTYLLRRPALALRSIFAMYVMVPVAALALVFALPLSTGARAALLVFAVSAGAPLLPRKLSPFGNSSYVFSLVTLSSVLAIFLVPAWVSLISAHFDLETTISMATVAKLLAKAFLLPLAIGMVVRAIIGDAGDKLSDALMKIAGGVLLVTALVLLATNWELMLKLRGEGMIALVALILIALAIGHLMGGPDEDDRTALAIACATRHIGIALVVASAFPGPATVVIVLAYTIATAMVSLPYLRWRRKLGATRQPQ